MKQFNLIIMAAVLVLTPAIVFAEFTGGSDSPAATKPVTSEPVTADTPVVSNDEKGVSVAEFIKLERLQSSSIVERVEAGLKSVYKLYTLQGKIVGQLHGNLYRFKDETGSVTVKIDDFKGVKVGFDDVVKLVGEPDYYGGELALDVQRLELAIE